MTEGLSNKFSDRNMVLCVLGNQNRHNSIQGQGISTKSQTNSPQCRTGHTYVDWSSTELSGQVLSIMG